MRSISPFTRPTRQFDLNSQSTARRAATPDPPNNFGRLIATHRFLYTPDETVRQIRDHAIATKKQPDAARGK